MDNKILILIGLLFGLSGLIRLFELNRSNELIEPTEPTESNNNITTLKKIIQQISIPRQIESKGLKQVKKYVKNIMLDIGLEIYEQKFNQVIKNKTYKMSNIIGYNKKASKKYILLGAHIDSHKISNTEACIDSATCIGIILELAKNILQKNPSYPIMVAFFDGEESIDGIWHNDTTLFGSSYFVNNIDLNQIEKTYIFDLIGGDIKTNKIVGFNDLTNTFNDLSTLSKINKKIYGKDDQIFIDPKEYTKKQSPADDHYPFVKKNKWVLNLIPYKFPIQHHKPSDTFANVNWKYIEIFYNVLFIFLLEI